MSNDNTSLRERVKDARVYLEEGGLAEVMGLSEAALRSGHPKIQMDTDMAVALCLMTIDLLNRTKAH